LFGEPARAKAVPGLLAALTTPKARSAKFVSAAAGLRRSGKASAMLVSIAPPASETRAGRVGGEKRLVTASTCHEPDTEKDGSARERNGVRSRPAGRLLPFSMHR
jgi:hypothetical protein